VQQQQDDEQQIPQEATRVSVPAPASIAAAAVVTPDTFELSGPADPTKHKGSTCGP
jgi:hypothetical protein